MLSYAFVDGRGFGDSICNTCYHKLNYNYQMPYWNYWEKTGLHMDWKETLAKPTPELKLKSNLTLFY